MNDFSIIKLLFEASIFVQIIVVLLVFLSICSWAIIFTKQRKIKNIIKLNEVFDREFWSGNSLNNLFMVVQRNFKHYGEPNVAPAERIFASGMREYEKSKEKQFIDLQLITTAVQRAMNSQLQLEVDRLDTGLSFLGSIASSAPYIGLLGTVWGIMHAFTGFSAASQVTLATVAPAISEALVATAIGLITAIPAVLAFNHFNRQNERIVTRLETFTDDFTNIMQRNSHKSSIQS